MKAYLVTTAVAFGVLALLHVARLFAEGAHLLGEPIFLVTTIGSFAACVWAIALLRSGSEAERRP